MVGGKDIVSWYFLQITEEIVQGLAPNIYIFYIFHAFFFSDASGCLCAKTEDNTTYQLESVNVL